MPNAIHPIRSKMQLKKLISENKTDQVFRALMDMSDKVKDQKVANAIINLSAQYKRFSHQSMLQATDADQQIVSLASLNNSILVLIDQLPESLFIEPLERRAIDINRSDSGFESLMNKSITILFIILLFGSILGFFAAIVLFFMSDGSSYSGNELMARLFPTFASVAGFIFALLIYIIIIKPQRKP